MNLGTVDLDLFVVLHALLEERSATRAAQRLHLTRPAVSNALARLRELYGDPLFVRSGRGLAPTPRALQVAPLVAAALNSLGATFESGKFEPENTTRRFCICCTDYVEVVILPRLFELFSRRLPRAALRIVTPAQVAAPAGLGAGEVDVVLGLQEPARPGWYSEPLFEDELVCVVRTDHPRVGQRLTLGAYVALGEVEVALFGDRQSTGARMAAQAFAEQGQSRNIVLSVPDFTAAAMAVAHTDRVASLPGRLAGVLARWLPLRILPLPIQFPALRIGQLWSITHDDDTAVGFLRGLIREASQAQPRARRVPRRPSGRRARRDRGRSRDQS
jgi:DNA-binding transcriptional LysR family regulator